MPEKFTETQVELAVCYWREGALDEARVTLKEALGRIVENDSEQRLRGLVTLGVIENSASRYQDALLIYAEAGPFIAQSSDHALRGAFHNQHALAYMNLGEAEDSSDYIDRAFLEFTAAGYHFEQAGHTRYLALVENNLGFLFLTAKKPVEAHQHLNRARALFTKLRDKGSIAQVDETRARAFLAQGLNSQAENAVRGSVRALEEGDESSSLAEALVTHGNALAQLERFERAHGQFRRAIDVAGKAGDVKRAGLAALTIAETLNAHVPAADLREYYRKAEFSLAQTQSRGIDERLGRCARLILTLAEANSAEATASSTSLPANGDEAVAEPQTTHGESSSLENEVMRYEGELIRRALESVGGSVTRAARLLGITHQGLAFILNGRHRHLLTARTPVKKRRKSIFRAQ
jgi:tetratricopeptide (TPR) repeat protein